MYVFCSRPTPKSRPGNIIVPAIIIAAKNYTRKYRDDDNLRRTIHGIRYFFLILAQTQIALNTPIIL